MPNRHASFVINRISHKKEQERREGYIVFYISFFLLKWFLTDQKRFKDTNGERIFHLDFTSLAAACLGEQVPPAA